MKKIEGMQTLDWLMLVMVIFVMTTMDYSNMETQDIILTVCIVAWVIMLVVRLYIVNFRK